MCYDAKTSLLSWILISTIAGLMWTRNEGWDRSLSPFIFCLGLIQLIEYLYHAKHIDGPTAGKFLYITLFLQGLIFAFTMENAGSLLSVPTYLTTGLKIAEIIFFISAVKVALFDESNLTVKPFFPSPGDGKDSERTCIITSIDGEKECDNRNHLAWVREGEKDKGPSKFLNTGQSLAYVIGITVPLLLMIFSALYDKNMGLIFSKYAILPIILLLYGAITNVLTGIESLWCFSVTGLAFLAWIVPYLVNW